MKIKDLPLLEVLGDDFKLPISDITSDRALGVSLKQLAAYVTTNIKVDDVAKNVVVSESQWALITASQTRLEEFCLRYPDYGVDVVEDGELPTGKFGSKFGFKFHNSQIA